MNILRMAKFKLNRKIYWLISIFILGYICGFVILNLNYYRNPIDPFYTLKFSIEKNPSEKYLSFIRDSKIENIYKDTFQILVKEIKDQKIQDLTDFDVLDLTDEKLIISFAVDKNVSFSNVNDYADTKIVTLYEYSNEALISLANKITNLLKYKFEQEMQMLDEVFNDRDKWSKKNEQIYINRKLDIVNYYTSQRSQYDYLIFNLNTLGNFNIYLDSYEFNKSRLNFFLPAIYGIILTILNVLYFIFTNRIELKIEYKN